MELNEATLRQDAASAVRDAVMAQTREGVLDAYAVRDCAVKALARKADVGCAAAARNICWVSRIVWWHFGKTPTEGAIAALRIFVTDALNDYPD